jgi:archaellum biogenesis protein FlaJ (TadC family)
MVFLLLYKFPYYILESKKKEIDVELENTIRHLSVLDDDALSVNDVLNILLKLENNELLTEEARRIITLSGINSNLKDTLRQAVKDTYSELEKNFFRKLIDVIDNKEKIGKVVSDFLITLEQSRKEASEEKKSRINLLFEVNIFLFFFIIILLTSLFLVTLDHNTLRSLLMFIAIIFPIVEFILIVILFK